MLHCFFELHHLIVVQRIDRDTQLISISHQWTEHDNVFDRLSISITQTRRRVNFEHFTSVQKVDEVDFLRTNLRRQWTLDFSQSIVQLESCLVYLTRMSRNRTNYDVSVDNSIIWSLLRMILLDLSHSLLDELFSIWWDSRIVRSRCEWWLFCEWRSRNDQLSNRSNVLQLLWDDSMFSTSISSISKLVDYVSAEVRYIFRT